MLKLIRNKLFDLFYPEKKYFRQSFSQDGEDMVLNAFYEGRGRHKGFYVDIGAHHPYRLSNTAFFYRKGWKGLNIEPTPSLIKAFYKHRKRDVNLNIGVSDSNSKLTFYEFNEPALNSFDKEMSLERSKLPLFKIIAEREIPVYTLSEVLNKYVPENQKIDFFTIDAEGFDLAILQSNDWNKYIPNFILIEGDCDFENLAKNEIYTFLKNKGYDLISKTRRTFVFGSSDNKYI
jgi:FkbM family methyltransferase